MSSEHLREIARRFAGDFRRHDITGIAAELAYRFLFALFPFALFIAALGALVAGWLGIQNPAQELVGALGDNLPPDLAASIQPELQQVVEGSSARLVSIAGAAAVWAATGGTNALIKAMNRALEVEEDRPLLYRLGLAVGLTMLGGAAILVSFVTIVGGALLTTELAERLGLTGGALTVASLLRWPIVFILLLAAVATLFRYAPNARVAWRWNIAGAAVFAVGWLAATWAFAWYVGSYGNYGSTYGSLGAVIVVMLWFYGTGILLVCAAELITGIAAVVEPESLQRRRDEIAERQARAAEEGAKRVADGLLDRVRAAFGKPPGPPTDDPPRDDIGPGGQDRRVGALDRRRPVEQPPEPAPESAG
jgi:membrane protein